MNYKTFFTGLGLIMLGFCLVFILNYTDGVLDSGDLDLTQQAFYTTTSLFSGILGTIASVIGVFVIFFSLDK